MKSDERVLRPVEKTRRQPIVAPQGQPLPAITWKATADIERSLTFEALEQLPFIPGDVQMLLGAAGVVTALKGRVLLARIAKTTKNRTAPGKSVDRLEKTGEIVNLDGIGAVPLFCCLRHQAATASGALGSLSGAYCAAASPPPLMRSAREASRNLSISPSSTACVLE